MKLPDSEYDYALEPNRNVEELKYLLFKLLMLLLRYYVHDISGRNIYIDTREDLERIDGIEWTKYVVYVRANDPILARNVYSRAFPSDLCQRGLNNKRIDDTWYLFGFKFILKDFKLPMIMFHEELRRRILENIFLIVNHMTVTNINFYLPAEFMSSRLLFDKHFGEQPTLFNESYVPYVHFDWKQLNPIIDTDLWDSVRLLHVYVEELEKHMKELLSRK